ncbi:MAG: 50S ribosomal protein L25/general stress protein Ctc [Rickettsiales bacterium]|nr:50S ribosomal protein L25/general stress protein Ctc [Rickettsiales bacterium]
MASIILNGGIRKDLGSANTNRLRKSGFIPAVVYGDRKKENIFISISKRDFDKEYLKGGIEVKSIELNIDGNKQNVIAYQIELDPLTDLPNHIDFMSIDGKDEIKTFVPVVYVGNEKSPGLKKGGFLNILKRKLHLFVSPKDIPQSVSVDVSSMHIGSKIKISDVKLPSNAKTVDKSDFIVCSITGRGKSEETKTAETTTTATTTAPSTTTTDAKTQPTAVAAKK